ncbi:uncharacterized protein [Dysidea avara]|uniref:uncharacterized protein isoform X2 n=1 Tax=Dysidea avara TaxID=196820 RepID=UPI0033251E23
MDPDTLKTDYSTAKIKLCGKKLITSVTHCLPKSEPKEYKIPSVAIPEFHIPAVIELNIKTKTDIFHRNVYGSSGNWLCFIMSQLSNGLKYASNQYQQQMAIERPTCDENSSLPNISSEYSSTAWTKPIEETPSSLPQWPQSAQVTSMSTSNYNYKSNCMSSTSLTFMQNEERFSVGFTKDQTVTSSLECDSFINTEKLSEVTLLHTVYHVLHPKGSTCGFNGREDCEVESDINFAVSFKNYLINVKECSCPHDQHLCAKCNQYWKYVKQHLEDRKCPLDHCPKLWEICIHKQQYKFCKYTAPPGLVLCSDNPKRVAIVQKEYNNFKRDNMLGCGGFARVYQVILQRGGKLALKEELLQKMPTQMKMNARQLKILRSFNHKNVIKIKEVVIGQPNAEGRVPFLYVMPSINRRGLNEQFKTGQRSILEYLKHYPGHKDIILRNYLVVALHINEGLAYFEKLGLIHGDIKRSNLLVRQYCRCRSIFLCSCWPVKFNIMLADFDFIKEATTNVESAVWANLLPYEPAGTVGMKAPELHFVDAKGNLVVTPKADMWSTSVTIMHGLLGRVDQNDYALDKINEFCGDVSNGVHQNHELCQEGIEILEEIFKQGNHQHNVLLNKALQIFMTVKSNMVDQCYFQTGFRHNTNSECNLPVKKHEEKKTSPMANIMTSVHVACTMPQVCLAEMPGMFQSDDRQQRAMKKIWKLVQDGLCFRPSARPKASQVCDDLNQFIREYYP